MIDKLIKEYEKPKIIRMAKMNFPIDIINVYSKEKGWVRSVCRQCSS